MKVGTRGSDLALEQTRMVESRLSVDLDRVIVETSGDRFEGDVSELGTQGVFVRELDLMVADGEIDAAVHSMKDMPTERPEGVEVAAVLPRDSAADALVTAEGVELEDLPAGAVVGTSSARRLAQVLRRRDDVEVRSLRGNVDTRVEKVLGGEYDAAVLSTAGLERLDLDVPRQELDVQDFVPSANQGVVAVVALDGSDAFDRFARIDHRRTRVETTAERVVLAGVGGGCIVPLGAYASIRGDRIEVTAEVVTPGGEVRVEGLYPLEHYIEGAEEVVDEMVERGARDLLEDAT